MMSRHKKQQHCAANPPTIMSLATSDNLTQAYQWACKSRGNSSSNNSIWHLRWNWQHELEDIQSLLLSGNYTLSPLQSYFIDGEYISSWCARDAVVLKALFLTLQPQFTPDTYPHCRHLANAGGIHATVQQIRAEQSNYSHLLKSDIYHYYESIDHQVL